MSYLLAQDSLRGTAGKAFMISSGENTELFGLKKFELYAEVQTGEFKVVGALVDQTKPKGLKYTGNATVYYGTPAFRKVLEEYKRTGRFPEISFQIENNDPGSTVGKQITAVYGVILTKIPIAMLDDSTDSLQEEISFTATDYETLQHFAAPSKLG